MSQIHFDKSRTQSDGSSVDEEYVISQFLNGSTDYRLSVAIRYATSGITAAVPSYLGQSFNNTTSDASVALSRGEPLTTQVEVSNVRYKQHGLDIDFNFRASELSFRWPNFGALGSAYKRRTLRFYLQVTLVPTSALSGKDPIYLLRTGWYKIKNVEKIYNTGSSSGIDAQIEAVSWVYEFNEKIQISYIGVPSDTDTDTDASKPSFLRSPARLFYLEKILHDRRRLNNIDYSDKTAVYEEDAPSGYRGVFFRESDASPENLIADLPRIVCPSCEETALTLFARLLTFKGAIKPDAYGNPADDGQMIVDHPVLAWRDLTYLSRYGQYLSEWWAGGTYGLDNFDSVLDSDSVLIVDCARKYLFKKYSARVPQIYSYFFLEFPIISGWISAGIGSARFESHGSTIATPTFSNSVDIFLSSFNYGTMIAIGSSEISRNTPDDYAPFQVNKNNFSYFRPLWETAFDPNYTDVTISVEYDLVYISTTYLTILGSQVDIEYEEVELDFGGLGYASVTTRNPSLYQDIEFTFSTDSVVYKYSQFLRKIEFSAEWRPWITIYDVVRVTYKDDSGVNATSFVFIQDIDANADTMSATYTGYILED